jgi:hypothetical protein
MHGSKIRKSSAKTRMSPNRNPNWGHDRVIHRQKIAQFLFRFCAVPALAALVSVLRPCLRELIHLIMD